MLVTEEIEKSIAHMLGMVFPEYLIVIDVVLVPGAKFLNETGFNVKLVLQLWVYTRMNSFEFYYYKRTGI